MPAPKNIFTFLIIFMLLPSLNAETEYNSNTQKDMSEIRLDVELLKSESCFILNVDQLDRTKSIIRLNHNALLSDFCIYADITYEDNTKAFEAFGPSFTGFLTPKFQEYTTNKAIKLEYMSAYLFNYLLRNSAKIKLTSAKYVEFKIYIPNLTKLAINENVIYSTDKIKISRSELLKHIDKGKFKEMPFPVDYETKENYIEKDSCPDKD